MRTTTLRFVTLAPIEYVTEVEISDYSVNGAVLLYIPTKTPNQTIVIPWQQIKFLEITREEK